MLSQCDRISRDKFSEERMDKDSLLTTWPQLPSGFWKVVETRERRRGGSQEKGIIVYKVEMGQADLENMKGVKKKRLKKSCFICLGVG